MDSHNCKSIDSKLMVEYIKCLMDNHKHKSLRLELMGRYIKFLLGNHRHINSMGLVLMVLGSY